MTFTKLSLCVVLLLWFCHGAHGARTLISARVQDVSGGIRNWDSYDPPSTPLPPCDFKHQNPGLDCSADPHPAATDVAHVSQIAASADPVAASDTQSSHAQQWPELPPCNFPSAIPGWNCFDPPTTPPPPCDFKHQRAGFDCWPNSPPASNVTQLTDDAASGGAFTSTQSGAHRVQGMLPPCNFPGAIPGWDCFDPPTTPLPPCDFKHQRAGFDCWPNSPPASKATELTDDAASGGAITSTQSGAHRVQGMLPPCNFPGAIPGWDCFDPPTTPLPPCDFKHQRAGFDCWPNSPPASKATELTDDAASGGAITSTQSGAHRVQGMLPPCNFPGAIPGWDCFDPPTTPLPPCDFKHQRAGFDCWPNSPPASKATQLTDDDASGGAFTSTQSGAHRVQGMLPPCNFPGTIPGLDCFDPPQVPLPPCDFKHQRAGFDCWPREPPASAYP